jgi:DNA polymerase-4
LDEEFLRDRFGKWGLALAGKSRGEDAGGWFDQEVGADTDPKSISHEHTFSTDTADVATLEETLAKLSEMVAKRLRQKSLHARTIELKLRNHEFQTITRALSLDHATQLDREVKSSILALFRAAWDGKMLIRLVGVHAGSLGRSEGQLNLLEASESERLRKAFQAVDHIRDKYGSTSISSARTMRINLRERVHENPNDLPANPKK